MTFKTGTQLGPYEIVAPLGAGGMGEVYRARDTKLDRDIAIKVLPATFVRDPERVAVLSPETFWTFLREFSPLCPIAEGSLAVKVGARALSFRADAVLRHSGQMPARISLR